MDFKVAGDGDGISAFQMDIKVEGITPAVLREALESARVGLVHILGEMDKADPAPAGRMSVYAPQVEVVEVPQKYIGKVIGKGGEQIKAICEQTKIDTIDVNEEESSPSPVPSAATCPRRWRSSGASPSSPRLARRTGTRG